MLRHHAAVLALFLAATSGVGPHASAHAQAVLDVRVVVAPPPLPTYVQPVIPADGYLWVPGYWDWDADFGYFWVPGTWVLPPRPNLLWTPGYWGWDDGAYLFHRGYWDVEVGYYGGIDYGYGYVGTGYQGGYWDGPRFFYNRTVTNISTISITNVFAKTVIVAAGASAVSYNGGAGGLTARPTPRQVVIAQQAHVQPTRAQAEQLNQARALPMLRATTNHGVPPIAATPRAAAFHSPEATAAKPERLPPPKADAAVLPKPGTPPGVEKADAIPAAPGVRDAASVLKPDASRKAATPPAPTALSPESRARPQPATQAPLQNDAAHQQATAAAQQAEAQRRDQQQADAARRRQEDEQARQRSEAAQNQQQAAQRAAAQAEAQKQAASEAQRREQAAQQARQAAAAAEQNRAMAAARQRAEQQARAHAAQQQAGQQRRPAEPHREEPARRPDCGRPGEPPCR